MAWDVGDLAAGLRPLVAAAGCGVGAVGDAVEHSARARLSIAHRWDIAVLCALHACIRLYLHV